MAAGDAISERVSRDPENDLAAIRHGFQESGESVWHIDRHVLDPMEAEGVDAGGRAAACAAGLALLRRWSSQRLSESSSGIFISEPYLVVDDGWIEGAPDAAPPHVYICLAVDEDSFMPVQHGDAAGHPVEPPPLIGALLSGSEAVYRASGAFEDEPGAWLIKLAERA
jgi:hypothetical protein